MRRTPFHVRLALLLALLLLILAPRAMGGPMRQETLRFSSGGRLITVDAYVPDDGSRLHPAVLVLHGSAGLEKTSWRTDRMCRRLCESGYAAYRVHYFERTGHVSVNRAETQQFCALWLETVSDAVRFVSLQPDVDGQRIAVAGTSLGACLALAQGATNPLVKVVIDFYGKLAWPQPVKLQRMVPTLILHGEIDSLIPVSEAREIMRQMDALHVPYEAHIYPNEEHNFSKAVQSEAESEMLRFLKRL